MVSDKKIRLGGSIYKAGVEVDVAKADVPDFQALGFRRARVKPTPKQIMKQEVEIHMEEEVTENG